MKKSAALSALFLAALVTGCAHPQPARMYPPPPAYSEAARQGFHDGIRAAQSDVSRGERPDLDRHPRFDRPPVPPPLVEDYRHGFREGYERVIHGGADD